MRMFKKNFLYISFKNFQSKFFAGFSLLILNTILTVFIPVLIRNLINSVILLENKMWVYSAFIFISVFIREALMFGASYYFEIAVRSLSEFIRNKIFSTIQINYRKFNHAKTGAILTYLDTDTHMLGEFIYPTAVLFLRDLLVFIFALIVGLYLNFKIIIESTVPLFLFFLMFRIINPRIRRLTSLMLESKTDFIARVKELIESREVFAVFLKQKFSIKMFKNFNKNFTENDINRIKTIILSNFPLTFFFNSGFVIAILLGAYFLKRGEIKVGTFFAVLIIVEYIYNSSKRFWDFNVHLQEVKAVFNRLERILENRSIYKLDIGLGINSIKILEVKDLTLKYDGKVLLENINFTARPSELVVITGKSGVGKTSLIRAILGLYEGIEDSISINGIPLGKISLEKYYRLVSYLPQRNYVFNGTVYENITLGDNISIENEILEILSGIPLQKNIQEGGRNLSGGEIRRIMIARTFVKNDIDMYILDEPFINLDWNNIDKIITLIKKKLEDRIIILVTHTPEFVGDLSPKLVKII